MTDQEKVLINAYYDGETTPQETLLVEGLIKKDDDARSYFESLKEVNVQLNLFEQSSEIETVKKWTTQFVAENIEAKPTLLNQIKNFVESSIFRHAVGYSLSAAFFITIGINFPSEDNSINYLQDFSAEETLNFDYQKFRNESSDDLSEKIKQSLENMIENKTLNATLAWGGDNYFLSIEESILNSDTMNCYSGTIFNEGNSSKFSFCQNQNDSIFSYITDN